MSAPTPTSHRSAAEASRPRHPPTREPASCWLRYAVCIFGCGCAATGGQRVEYAQCAKGRALAAPGASPVRPPILFVARAAAACFQGISAPSSSDRTCQTKLELIINACRVRSGS